MDDIVYYIIALILLIILIAYLCFYKHINLFIVAITGKKRIQKKLYKACKVNDLLILNDIYLPVGNNKYKYIDTIIFGNKYIYITKEVKQAGKVKVSIEDSKWRIIYNQQLTLIDNPFLSNKKVINYLINIVEGLEEKDLKNLVVLSKTCSVDGSFESQNELIATENNAIKVILDFEKKSNEDIFVPSEVERYCKAFYEEGLKAEKIIKGRK